MYVFLVWDAFFGCYGTFKGQFSGIKISKFFNMVMRYIIWRVLTSTFRICMILVCGMVASWDFGRFRSFYGLFNAVFYILTQDRDNRTRFFSKILRILLSFRICNWFVRAIFGSGDIWCFRLNYRGNKIDKNMKFSNRFNIVMLYTIRRVLPSR